MPDSPDMTAVKLRAESIVFELFASCVLSPVQAAFEEDEDNEEPFEPDDDDELDDDDIDEDDLDEDDEDEAEGEDEDGDDNLGV